MKRLEREWMYKRVDSDGLRRELRDGVDEFIEFAKRQKEYEGCEKFRCPCSKCKNLRFHVVDEIKVHLYRKGFVPNYFKWTSHGELVNVKEPTHITPNNVYHEMVMDGLGATAIDALEEPIGEEPNPRAKEFFELLRVAQEPLFEGSEISTLEMASRIINLKCEHNLSHRCVDGFSSLVQDVMPSENSMARNFYDAKKVLKALELPHVKYDMCRNGCMLFWKDDVELLKCKDCGADRYKRSSKGKPVPVKVLIHFPIGPRCQRLYATKTLAEQMRWHAENPRKAGTLSHPSDGEAWKDFDATYVDFAKESRNVRLGLCTDGFSPFGKFGKTYSCWPVILTPYNLPPWLCMKREFMFLSLLIPGPKNPKGNIDVCLQPLIEELKVLWEEGILTYDVSTKTNFVMKAALMWTISDFPAYSMLSGWSTSGEFACPYCMDKTKTFWLGNCCKMSWFDCHRQFLPFNHAFRRNKNDFYKNRVETDPPPPRLSGHEVWESVSSFSRSRQKNKKSKGWKKQSIFWELPYWKNLLVRHNLDVMHIEKNFFDQLINTIMDVNAQSADSLNARKDLACHCKRPNLEVIVDSNDKEILPKAPYTLDKVRKRVLCEWIQKLKFPDGYVSNLSKCIDSSGLKLIGMKSHDCHVFMERLLPIAFKHLLPMNVWNAITEISQFFRDLCVSSFEINDMIRLEENIPEILCKLEKIFPPSFFNCMEHLPIHLPYEAKVGGPVQYRWMYPFERFLNHLKKKVGNKARVEGCICNAYLTEEISNFCAQYFDRHIDTKARDLGRNQSIESYEQGDSSIPDIFRGHGGDVCYDDERRLSDMEYDRAHLYVLSNCEILGEYEKEFERYILQIHPNMNPNEIWSKFEEDFPKWFRQHVIDSNVTDDVVRALAMRPSRKVNTLKRHSVNGFKFHTFEYGNNKTTMNYGVCVKGLDEVEYYGILEDIIELVYYGPKKSYKTILFKCNWMDSINGVNIHERYKLVEVNHTKKYPKYDPFVLACQAQQVYFSSYPSLKNDRKQWWVVCKTKARSNIEAPIDKSFFQESVVLDPPSLSCPDDEVCDDVEMEQWDQEDDMVERLGEEDEGVECDKEQENNEGGEEGREEYNNLDDSEEDSPSDNNDGRGREDDSDF